MLPTLNFNNARPNCDLDYVPNDFRDRKINLFMKNNYAFGGNNCSMIISMDPCSVPVSVYDEKRVAISGLGAVSAIGHTVNEILDNVWKQSQSVELGASPSRKTRWKKRKSCWMFSKRPVSLRTCSVKRLAISRQPVRKRTSTSKPSRSPALSRVNICVASIREKPPVAVRLR